MGISQKVVVAPIRILLADDQPTILRMVRMILKEYPHLVVVGDAPNGADAVVMVATLRPDVVVLNVTMPKMSGFEAARRIHAESPSVAIVILSTHKDAQFIAAAKACGARGYVDKQNAATELVHAINRTARGEEFFLQ
jgi:two-component system, NarL family, nitrate/nitrite response regulator NarL